MSIKIPAGHGPSALPIGGKSWFKNNLPIAIREGLANAITYGATHCHAVRLLFPNGELYLCVMHDGRSFIGGVDEIKKYGLTPNQSGNEGWSFQGNGLSFVAAYLAGIHPKLIIASKKGDELSVASATIDHMKNDWLINDEPEFGQSLKEILGPRWYDTMKVFYLFRLPDSEKEAKDGYGMRFNNNLTYLAPSMVAKSHVEGGPPKITIAEGLFFIGKKDKSGENEYASLSDCPRTGNWNRNLASPEEFSAKFCEQEWTFDTEVFTLKRDGWEFDVYAEITVLGFPGTKSMNRSGTDNHQWLGNVRDGKFGGKVFEKGKGVGMGVKPNHTVYLYIPCIGSDNSDERFSRFKDNAVGMTWHPSSLFAGLGLAYNENTRGRKGDPKPFGIMRINIVHLDDKMRHPATGEVEPVSPIHFANVFGRRADFLFDSSACRDIMTAATNAGKGNVPEDCRKWFTDHFPSNNEDRVPIIFGQPMVEPEVDEYTIYDLKTGEKFPKKFHAGENHILAVWSHRLVKFVTEMHESSITRGVEITRVPHELLDVASDIKEGYQTLHQLQVSKSKIQQHEHIPFFNVAISELSRLEEDKSWTPITFGYEHNENYRPSRGVHVVLSGNVRLGVVVEVPPRPGQGGDMTRKRGGRRHDGVTKRMPYCQRHSRIFVEYDFSNKFLKLNSENPTFALYYNAPDAVGSSTQKILADLYWMLNSIAYGAALGVKEPTKCEHAPLTNDFVDEEDKPIYEDNRWDFVVNMAIEHFMLSPYVINALETVRELRSNKVA